MTRQEILEATLPQVTEIALEAEKDGQSGQEHMIVVSDPNRDKTSAILAYGVDPSMSWVNPLNPFFMGVIKKEVFFKFCKIVNNFENENWKMTPEGAWEIVILAEDGILHATLSRENKLN